MEEIKNFIYSHSSPNGCVALTRKERARLLALIKVIDDERKVALKNWNTVLDERNENAEMLTLAIDDHISQSPFIKPEHIESAKAYYFENLKERAKDTLRSYKMKTETIEVPVNIPQIVDTKQEEIAKQLTRIADALEILASTVNSRGNIPRLLVSNNGN